MAAFSASLISSLAVQLRHLPFRDLQGLVNDGSYRLGVVQNFSLLNIFDVCLRRMILYKSIQYVIYVCMFICMYIYVYVRMYVCNMYVYIFLCVYVCI